MHMCSKKSFVTVFLLFSLLGCSFGSKFVPFLLWTNTGGSKCQHQSPGISEQRVSEVLNAEYMECLSAINPDRVIVFVYDQLSIEDFTLYGKAFNNIENSLKKADTSFFAQSVEPVNIIEDVTLTMKRYFPQTEIDEVLLPKIDRSTHETTLSELEMRDREIERKLEGVTGSYIAIVTSEGNAKEYGDVGKGPQRHLLQTAPDNGNATHIKGECIYMYFTQLTFTELSKQYSLSLDENVAAMETCSNTTGLHTLNLTFTSSPNDIKDVTILFVFLDKLYPVSGRRWWSLDQVSMNYMNNNERTTHDFNPRYFNETVSAPDEWSYVCAEPANLTSIDKVKNGNAVKFVELEFKNWQLQPFNVTGGEFSRATDCSGWYTGPIWTGLLVSLLLIGILSYGIVMLGYVTTMDRFDDPKKKTITVPQDN